jgi:hypothetical protein
MGNLLILHIVLLLVCLKKLVIFLQQLCSFILAAILNLFQIAFTYILRPGCPDKTCDRAFGKTQTTILTKIGGTTQVLP